jgi:hypothetical protein
MVATPDITKTEPAGVQPPKRGPGRPRKNPLPPVVTPDAVAAETALPEPATPARTWQDDRIGFEVDPRAEAIGFDDGRTYRCADGVIVERLT